VEGGRKCTSKTQNRTEEWPQTQLLLDFVSSASCSSALCISAAALCSHTPIMQAHAMVP